MSIQTVQQIFDAAVRYHQAGNLSDAEKLYQQIIKDQPHHADALHLLGVLTAQSGRRSEGVEYIRRAIAINPSAEIYYSNLAQALLDQGSFDEAVIECREALRLNPNFVPAYNVLGAAQSGLGQYSGAAESYLQALRLKPDDSNAYNHLGNICLAQGRVDKAIAAFQSALRFKPKFPEALNNLGKALNEKGMDAESLKAYRAALELKPDFAEAHNNIGVILHAHNQFDEAAAAYQMAIKLKPAFADAYNNLAITLKDQGKLDEAIDAYRTALKLKPDFARAHSNLIFTMQYHPGYDIQAIGSELKEWNCNHASEVKKFIRPHENDRNPDRRLRIGYVSADFHENVCVFFLDPLLRSHDHAQFEIFCYAQIRRPDSHTLRFKSYADHWCSTIGLSDLQLANQIYSDQIDILVDLKLHTHDNRLLIFAYKPAPVQATWLGYPGSTGLETIDYRFSDPYLDPPGTDLSVYKEQTLRLPDTFWCYDPMTSEPAINELPALKNGLITLGCLNNFCKINDGVLKIWTNVLSVLSKSRMILLAPQGIARQRLLDHLNNNGIDSSRVEFVDRQPRPQYLQSYHRIDLGLDSFPYNGHTTTMDSLWMGVPVVSLSGKTVVGRGGKSVLTNVGLPELIARTPQEYVQIAVQLVSDLPKLKELRLTLRRRMEQSPLMDAPRFARNIEAAYRDMWRKWCGDSIKRIENS